MIPEEDRERAVGPLTYHLHATEPLAPRNRREPDWAFLRRVQAHEYLEAFADRHKLREIRNTVPMARKLFMTGGKSAEVAKAVMRSINSYEMIAGPFDHGRLFARKGTPALLLGSPYQLYPEDISALHALHYLGLTVEVRDVSYYDHPAALSALCWAAGEAPGPVGELPTIPEGEWCIRSVRYREYFGPLKTA